MINVVSLPLLASLIRHRVLYSTTDGKSKDLLRSRQVANSNCHNAVSFTRQAIQEAVSQWLDFGSVLSTWGPTITFLGTWHLWPKPRITMESTCKCRLEGPVWSNSRWRLFTIYCTLSAFCIFYLLHTIYILHLLFTAHNLHSVCTSHCWRQSGPDYCWQSFQRAGIGTICKANERG